VSILDLATRWGHEEVVILQDAASGLRGILAVHDTRRGPAIAATRLRPHASIDQALTTALRLSHAVTRETAAADLPHGGGAAVLIGSAARSKERPLLAAYARALDRFSGRLLAAADIGFEERDLTVLGRMTKHLAYRPGPGDGVADLTAQAVFEGIRETATLLDRELAELHVAVQGLGQVGYRLVRLLAAAGVRLTVTDSDPARQERAQAEIGAATVADSEIYDVEADIFSPNADSDVLDDQTIRRLRCRAVVGGARDVLADPRHADTLHDRGILYAPDFVVCAGGLAGRLAVAAWDEEEDREMAVQERVAAVGDRLREIFRISREDGMSPLRAAQRLLEVRLSPRAGGAP
jgi:leucine dehydrogenase